EAWPNPAPPLTGHSHSDTGRMPGHMPAEDLREMAARAREDLLRGAHRTGRMHVSGLPKRPWEVIVGSAFGFIAPFFVLAALLWMAFTGGRTFRSLGCTLRVMLVVSGTSALPCPGDAPTRIALFVVAIVSAVRPAAVAAFSASAWRLMVGHGRPR